MRQITLDIYMLENVGSFAHNIFVPSCPYVVRISKFKVLKQQGVVNGKMEGENEDLKRAFAFSLKPSKRAGSFGSGNM